MKKHMFQVLSSNPKNIIYAKRCQLCHTEFHSKSKFNLWIEYVKHYFMSCKKIRIAKYKNEVTKQHHYIKQYENYISFLPNNFYVYKCNSCGHESLFAGNIVSHMRQHNFFNQLGDK